MIDLGDVLDGSRTNRREKLQLLGILSLGVVNALAHGAISAVDSIYMFFSAENCDFVRKKFRNKIATEIMDRGIQLDDVLVALPKRTARRAFRDELNEMRSLCHRLLDQRKPAASK